MQLVSIIIIYYVKETHIMINNSNTIGTDFKAFKLAGHFSVHAQVMKREWRGENKTDRYCAYLLKSYDTVVARITFKNCYFGRASVYGLYSTTTRKHIDWFFSHFDLNIPMDAIKVAAAMKSQIL